MKRETQNADPHLYVTYSKVNGTWVSIYSGYKVGYSFYNNTDKTQKLVDETSNEHTFIEPGMNYGVDLRWKRLGR